MFIKQKVDLVQSSCYCRLMSDYASSNLGWTQSCHFINFFLLQECVKLNTKDGMDF